MPSNQQPIDPNKVNAIITTNQSQIDRLQNEIRSANGLVELAPVVTDLTQAISSIYTSYVDFLKHRDNMIRIQQLSTVLVPAIRDDMKDLTEITKGLITLIANEQGESKVKLLDILDRDLQSIRELNRELIKLLSPA